MIASSIPGHFACHLGKLSSPTFPSPSESWGVNRKIMWREPDKVCKPDGLCAHSDVDHVVASPASADWPKSSPTYCVL